jgi:hypothetical protein
MALVHSCMLMAPSAETASLPADVYGWYPPEKAVACRLNAYRIQWDSMAVCLWSYIP